MDPNRPNWMRIAPLHGFARNGDIESAAVYLDHGADIEARDEEQHSTPLGWAAEAGQLRMVEFLLRRGAKVDPPSGPAWAKPIFWAQRRGHTAIVSLLKRYEREKQLPQRSLATFESLAADLVRSFAGNDETALERIIEHFRARRPLTWDNPPIEEITARLRRVVGEHLERIGRPIGEANSLDIADARELIARGEGFRDWSDLVSTLSKN